MNKAANMSTSAPRVSVACCSSPGRVPASLRRPLNLCRNKQRHCAFVRAQSVAVQQEAAAEEGTPVKGRLLPDEKSFAEQHWVRGYEVEPDRRLSIVSVGNLLQECATNHATSLWGLNEELGFAVAPVMAEKGLILVMTRQQIQMKKYPKWGQAVEVETWYQQEGRLAARRDWVVRDGTTKEVLGGATSTWVMVNMKTRKLSKIPDEMRDEFLPFAPDPPRFGLGDSPAKLKLPELEFPAEFNAPPQVARRADMDMNGHVNNTVFLGMALEAVPKDMYDNYILLQVEVDFKAEVFAGDSLESGASETEVPEGLDVPGGAKALLHVVRKQESEGGKELVRARTIWIPAA